MARIRRSCVEWNDSMGTLAMASAVSSSWHEYQHQTEMRVINSTTSPLEEIESELLELAQIIAPHFTGHTKSLSLEFMNKPSGPSGLLPTFHHFDISFILKRVALFTVPFEMRCYDVPTTTQVKTPPWHRQAHGWTSHIQSHPECTCCGMAGTWKWQGEADGFPSSIEPFPNIPCIKQRFAEKNPPRLFEIRDKSTGQSIGTAPCTEAGTIPAGSQHGDHRFT